MNEAHLVDALDIALFHSGVEHQPGDDEDEYREDLDESAEDGANTGVVFAFRAEHALDDGLIGAPIPDAEHRVA